MSTIRSEVNSGFPQALLRYMLYTDVNRRRATQVGTDMLVDAKAISSDRYEYGTKHKLIFTEIDDEPGDYIVAMTPFVREVPHPAKEGETIPLRLVYLTSAALWPFFDPIEGESFDRALLPE